MNNEKNVLPPDFNGVFNFTNFTEEDFSDKWANIEYTFPAKRMTPMIIPGATPEQVQNIRKKFARTLAEREFYKSEKLKALENQTPIGTVGSFKMAAVYTESDLTPYAQRCLEPLPIAQAKTRVLPTADETRYAKDKKGRNVTKILDENESLMTQASGSIE